MHQHATKVRKFIVSYPNLDPGLGARKTQPMQAFARAFVTLQREFRMLKYTATSIAPSLTKLFNISITLGRFPTCWKTSSVVPVPKSSKHNEVANYRPISLLPVVSKLLERHIHQVITTHLNETRPLSNKQWGFQPGKSTVTALLTVTHD